MLKQISIKNRTLFLELFTQELILNSKPYIEITIPEIATRTQIKKEVSLPTLQYIKKPTIITKEKVNTPIPNPEPIVPKNEERTLPWAREIGESYAENIGEPFPQSQIKPIAPEEKISNMPKSIIKPLTLEMDEEKSLPKIMAIENTGGSKVFSREVSLPDIKKIDRKIAEKKINEPLQPMKNIPPVKTIPLTASPPTGQEAASRIIHPVQKIEPRIKKPNMMVSAPRKIFTAPVAVNKPLTPLPVIAPPPNQEIDLGKLNILTSDPTVATIECPGPEKFIIVRKFGRANITSITLTQEEINKIVYGFSESARIPVIGGTFKAIVGELSINAIVTESVGKRFILYKTMGVPTIPY